MRALVDHAGPVVAPAAVVPATALLWPPALLGVLFCLFLCHPTRSLRPHAAVCVFLDLPNRRG